MAKKRGKSKRKSSSNSKSSRASSKKASKKSKIKPKLIAFKEMIIFFFLSVLLFWAGNNAEGNLGAVFEFFGYITAILALTFFVVLLILLAKRLIK